MAHSNPLDVEGEAPTVLVVDDNKALLEFLILLLSKHGMRALGAGGGPQCLEIVQSRNIDIVILDVMMPAMNGLRVCQELKRLRPSLPVILLTARDDMITRSAAMDLGVSEFVAKPINNRDLLDRIRTQLRTHQWEKKADEACLKIDPLPANLRGKE